MTDFCRTEATVRRYLQECHGDALYTYQIFAVYNVINTYSVSLFQSQIINESLFSTGNVVSHSSLNKRDRKLLAFRKEVDTVMLKAINECCGNFSD